MARKTRLQKQFEEESDVLFDALADFIVRWGATEVLAVFLSALHDVEYFTTATKERGELIEKQIDKLYRELKAADRKQGRKKAKVIPLFGRAPGR